MELCRRADTATYDWEQARGGRSGHLPGRVGGGCQLDSFKRRLKGTESGQDKRLLTSLPPPHAPQFNPFSGCLHPAMQAYEEPGAKASPHSCSIQAAIGDAWHGAGPQSVFAEWSKRLRFMLCLHRNLPWLPINHWIKSSCSHNMSPPCLSISPMSRSSFSSLYSSALAAIIKYQRMSVFNSRNVFSHGSGGWKSNVGVSAGLVSAEAPPWLVDGCLLSVSVCVQICSSYKFTSHFKLGHTHIPRSLTLT